MAVHCRYLRRFRNDPPLKRDERKAPSLHEFWWGPKRELSLPNRDRTASSRSKSRGSSHIGTAADNSALATDNSDSTGRDMEVSSDSTPVSKQSVSQVCCILCDAMESSLWILLVS